MNRYQIEFLKKNFARALLHPLSLAVFGMGVFTAILTGQWWIILVGLAGYGIVTWNYFTAFCKEKTPEEHQLESFDASKLPERYIPQFQQIIELQRKALSQISSSDNLVKPLLLMSVDKIKSLSQKTYEVTLRLGEVDGYLDAIDYAALLRQRDSVKQKIERADDNETKEEYSQAYKALEAQIENFNRLNRIRERLQAQLLNIRLSIENFFAKIITIKTTEVSGRAERTSKVTEELNELDILLDSASKTIEEFGAFRHLADYKERET
ncbi:hypothetical protein FJZ31_07820 [Candidatus Poribacteria bacterium]|nr:hypothetical protein [Candidatus Poribacteria bacterium]